MQKGDRIREGVRQYYGSELKSGKDLKTGACCCAQPLPTSYRETLAQIHPEVRDKFYGCGSPLPPALEGCTVLDLGCGTGRDVYVASRLVGPRGRVIGVDMTEEQLAVARKHQGFHAERFGFAGSNVVFHHGLIEDLSALGIEDASMDVVISNCVINLSPDKRAVFAEIFRVLKPGGELYFADVFADRRIPRKLRDDPVLRGECLGGAMYVQDFRRLLSCLGIPDYRVVSTSAVPIQDPAIQAKIGHVGFGSLLVRAFKVKGLEDRCEDYGQSACYLGTIEDQSKAFGLDDHHFFATDKEKAVCGNTAAMLSESRFAPHFRVTSGRSIHRGLFACGNIQSLTQCCEAGQAGPEAEDAPAAEDAFENAFERKVTEVTGEGLHGQSLEILQVNLGRFCNLSCRHCHLSCSPARKEMMSWSTMEQIIALARSGQFSTVDITGGSPELHPDFHRFVCALAENDIHILMRTNLVALLEPGQAGCIAFLREHKVELMASLPCFQKDNVDAQRGTGTYERSVRALQALNAVGYGVEADLPLNLVYNPGGAYLPGPQSELESAYRRELEERFGIRFTRLLTIANFPIGRFLEDLENRAEAETYRETLADAFNSETIDHLMCRHQVCVDYDGTLYDCDFNLGLGLSVNHGAPDRLERFDAKALQGRRVVTGEHCFGCTAGSGSSCGGALS